MSVVFNLISQKVVPSSEIWIFLELLVAFEICQLLDFLVPFCIWATPSTGVCLQLSVFRSRSDGFTSTQCWCWGQSGPGKFTLTVG